MFGELFAIVTVRDLSRARHFYRDLLGGQETYRFPAEGEPVYIGLRIGDRDLGLAEASGERPAGGGGPIELCAYAEDCDRAVAHLREHGVKIVEEPVDQPWGERMARVADPDGNILIILSR
jgi:lactoylglutathione lyase